ncbi:MAG: tRNA lysidine(34) synthetase TilS, partial [Planctomycetota bacterium]
MASIAHAGDPHSYGDPVMDHPPPALPISSDRWSRLARAAGIGAGERLAVALSGGADSVLVLHLVAAARPRPPLLAIHADHGLRGPASRGDALFCRDLCAALAVPFRELRLDLDPARPSLEARARAARYAALAAECRRTGHLTLVTGHHADDALETLLLRWIRGSDPAGLAGPRAVTMLAPPPGAPAPAVRVVRPLLAWRREEVRRFLLDRGLSWREDASNDDLSFARNRVRHRLLPLLSRLGGAEEIANLRAFGRAVEDLEARFAAATAPLAWLSPPYALLDPRWPASRGGVLPRAAL